MSKITCDYFLLNIICSLKFIRLFYQKSFYIKADTSFKPAAIETLKSGYDLQAMTFDEMKDENNFEISSFRLKNEFA